MTNEEIKDIRLSLDLIAKDLSRLAKDVKCLQECLKIQETPDHICQKCIHYDKYSLFCDKRQVASPILIDDIMACSMYKEVK